MTFSEQENCLVKVVCLTKATWDVVVVCFRRHCLKRSRGVEAPLSVRKQVSEWVEAFLYHSKFAMWSAVWHVHRVEHSRPRAFTRLTVFSVYVHFGLRAVDNIFALGKAFLGASTNLRLASVSFVTSLRPHRTTRLPIDRFSWNLILEYFSKICQGNWRFLIKSDKNNEYFTWIRIYVYNNLTEFVVERGTFQTRVVEKIKIRILWLNNFFPPSKVVPLMR